MADAARRGAVRRSDDPHAAGRALLERVRAGELDRPRLVLAARLGSRAARLALGDPPPGLCWPELSVEDGPGLTERVLAAQDQEPVVRSALAALVLGEMALLRFEAERTARESSHASHDGVFCPGAPGAVDLIDAWAVLALAERAEGSGSLLRVTVDLRDADGVARTLGRVRWELAIRPVGGQLGLALLRLEEALGFAQVHRLVQVREGSVRALLVETSVGVYALGRVAGRSMAEGWARLGFDARAERRASVELAQAKDDEARGMAYGARAQARGAQGDEEGAAADWEEAVRLRPQAVTPRWGQGLLRWRQGDLTGAAEVLGRAGALAGDLRAPLARLERVRVLLALGKHGDAVAEADGLLSDPVGVLDTSPAGTWADVRRGALVVRSSARRLAGRPDLALADAEAAVSARRGDVWPLLERGRVHEALGDVPRMRADAEAALRLAPDLSAALALRAQARALANDLPGAIEDLRAAVARRPDEPTHREELGRLLLAMGRPEEGQRELDEARRLAPWLYRAGEPPAR